MQGDADCSTTKNSKPEVVSNPLNFRGLLKGILAV
uniref:Uncharacterized protein n=1 Tax=Rhizophora mucronata TaxID=61149 RepID=A0A2P2PY75_RHIMU